MRSKGSSAVLEHRRCLAVRRLLEGGSTQEVAEFLEVERRTVQRWWRTFQDRGWDGLIAGEISGRPRKLTPTQEKIILRWLRDSPTKFGFETELWTCRRLAQLIAEEWDVCMNVRYLADWLRDRGFTPQKPQRIPREHEEEAIARWLAVDWPRLKKKPRETKPTSFFSMKAGF